MKKYTRLAAMSAAIALGVSGLGVSAFADDAGVRAGMLTCHVDSGWGFIFGSTRALKCTFSGGPGRIEHYAGDISKFGVDIGYTEAGVMVWAVLAPTADLAKGSIAGEYAGATAGAAVAVGASANVLIGGSNNHMALQPVSLEGMTGLNVAAGIAALKLTYQP